MPGRAARDAPPSAWAGGRRRASARRRVPLPAQLSPAQPAPGPPARTWPGTRPMAVQPKENFADLLPPVRYDQPAAFGLAPAMPGVPGQLAPAQPWPPVADASAARPGRPLAPGGAAGPPACSRARPRSFRPGVCWYWRHWPASSPSASCCRSPARPLLWARSCCCVQATSPPAGLAGAADALAAGAATVLGDSLLPVGCLPVGARLPAAGALGTAVRCGGRCPRGPGARAGSATACRRVRSRGDHRLLLHRTWLAVHAAAHWAGSTGR